MIWSAYRIMWALVVFDLPTDTKKERKAYSTFRKFLLKDGFYMMQYSVYFRHCSNRQIYDTHVRNIQKQLPEYGKVSIIGITDKQFGEMYNFWGKIRELSPRTPDQITMF